MNYTQKTTLDWINQSNLDNDALLLEALLRRGFLAFRDEEGVWLGTGSTWRDRQVLDLVEGIALEHGHGRNRSPEKLAAVRMRPSFEGQVREICARIVGLPEHHYGDRLGRWTRVGVGGSVGNGWRSYCAMRWGAKLDVCPVQYSDGLNQRIVANALDSGIALLVKALPLARVATSCSCDGHGKKPARIFFHFPWDVLWGKAVFDALNVPLPQSKWVWRKDYVEINPAGDFNDETTLGMLNDIQKFARTLLNKGLIDRIGVARKRTIAAFGENRPASDADFSEIAQRELVNLVNA